jgi:hypothetical protein
VTRETYLKRAETCLRLARGTTDRDLAERLHSMAAEFQDLARENSTPKSDNKK